MTANDVQCEILLGRDFKAFPSFVLDSRQPKRVASSLVTTRPPPPNRVLQPPNAPLMKPVFKKRTRSSTVQLEGVVSSFATFKSESKVVQPFTRNCDGGGADAGIAHSAFEYKPPVPNVDHNSFTLPANNNNTSTNGHGACPNNNNHTLSSYNDVVPHGGDHNNINHNHISPHQTHTNTIHSNSDSNRAQSGSSPFSGSEEDNTRPFAQLLELRLLTALMEEVTLHRADTAKKQAEAAIANLTPFAAITTATTATKSAKPPAKGKGKKAVPPAPVTSTTTEGSPSPAPFVPPLLSTTPAGKGSILALHTYNEIKDVTQKLCGLMATKRGVPFKEVAEELGLPDD